MIEAEAQLRKGLGLIANMPDGAERLQYELDLQIALSIALIATQGYAAPASPWQNGFVERLIGSIRRECVDHIIVLGEMHLRRVLKSYADYYNSVRTHRSLNKDAPVTRQIQRIGSIKSHAILGGLHHHYARA